MKWSARCRYVAGLVEEARTNLFFLKRDRFGKAVIGRSILVALTAIHYLREERDGRPYVGFTDAELERTRRDLERVDAWLL